MLKQSNAVLLNFLTEKKIAFKNIKSTKFLETQVKCETLSQFLKVKSLSFQNLTYHEALLS